MPNPDQPRSVEFEVEVAGTPEQVWEAIASGPGISAWFVPADVEPREGGQVTLHHGPDMDQSGTVSAWEPPQRFAIDLGEWQPTEAVEPGRMGLELLVETRAGGTCVVRLVNSGFGHGDDWDRALESVKGGWELCLHALQLYLANFPGERPAPVIARGEASPPQERAWAALTRALGLPEAPEPGQRLESEALQLAGGVERVDGTTLTLLLDQPAGGIGVVSVGGPAEVVYANLSASLFGDDAPAVAAREQAAWQRWLDENLA